MTMHARQLSRRERVVPWVALFLPPFAWVTYEYGAASGLRASCTIVGTWLGPVWGGVSLLECLLAAILAWPLARQATQTPPVRRWLARVATFAAGIFALAIGFQTLATLIIPACTR
jgi:hypothetical protein